LINQKATIQASFWGFIDDTLRRTCHPKYFQQLCYSGHKSSHGIKFQIVVFPDGMIASLFGPVPGSRHDSGMLGLSDLLTKLENMMPQDGHLGPVYTLYGDSAFPQSAPLVGGYRNAQAGSVEADFNKAMARVRESVEWTFKDILQHWKFFDMKTGMKIFKSPIAKYYIVAAFLTNLINGFYGGQARNFFNAMDFLTAQKYLELLSMDDLIAFYNLENNDE
jgi:hypothetical protein